MNNPNRAYLIRHAQEEVELCGRRFAYLIEFKFVSFCEHISTIRDGLIVKMAAL